MDGGSLTALGAGTRGQHGIVKPTTHLVFSPAEILKDEKAKAASKYRAQHASLAAVSNSVASALTGRVESRTALIPSSSRAAQMQQKAVEANSSSTAKADAFQTPPPAAHQASFSDIVVGSPPYTPAVAVGGSLGALTVPPRSRSSSNISNTAFGIDERSVVSGVKRPREAVSPTSPDGVHSRQSSHSQKRSRADVSAGDAHDPFLTQADVDPLLTQAAADSLLTQAAVEDDAASPSHRTHTSGRGGGDSSPRSHPRGAPAGVGASARASPRRGGVVRTVAFAPTPVQTGSRHAATTLSFSTAHRGVADTLQLQAHAALSGGDGDIDLWATQLASQPTNRDDNHSDSRHASPTASSALPMQSSPAGRKSSRCIPSPSPLPVGASSSSHSPAYAGAGVGAHFRDQPLHDISDSFAAEDENRDFGDDDYRQLEIIPGDDERDADTASSLHPKAATTSASAGVGSIAKGSLRAEPLAAPPLPLVWQGASSTAPCSNSSRASTLSQRWPGREEVLGVLNATMQTHGWAPNVMLYGVPGCGKSTFIRELFAASACTWGSFSIRTCLSMKQVHERFLHAIVKGILRGNDGVSGDGGSNIQTCIKQLFSALLAHGSPAAADCAASIARWSVEVGDFVPGLYCSAAIECAAAKAAASAAASSSGSHTTSLQPVASRSQLMRAVTLRKALTYGDLVDEISLLLKFTLAGDIHGLNTGGGDGGMNRTLHIVVDDADQVLSMQRNGVLQLLRLQSLVPLPLRVVLVATAGSALQASYAGCEVSPLELHFPRARQADVLKMLFAMCPVGHATRVFETFVEAVDRAFGNAVGYDLREMQYIIQLIYPEYIKPVLSGELAASSSKDLRARVAPLFESMRKRLLHRDSMSTLPGKGSRAAVGSATAAADAPTASATATKSSSSASTSVPAGRGGDSERVMKRERGLEKELPIYTKLLLIAGYCASHNPEDTDARLMANRGVKKGATQKHSTLSDYKIKSILSGPREFTLERVLGILHCLISNNWDEGRSTKLRYDDLCHQLATLVSLGFWERVKSPNELQTVMYRCNISLETAIALSNIKIGDKDFDLQPHLYDPES